MHIHKYLVFILVFITTVILDLIFFVGIFSQIQASSSVLNNFTISIVIFFWLIMGIPAVVAYFVSFKRTPASTPSPRDNKFAVSLALALGIVFMIMIPFLAKPRFAPYSLQQVSESEFVSPYPSFATVLPSPYVSNKPESSVFSTPRSTASSVPVASIQPSPTPRTPNPPIMNISYPQEGQSIVFTNPNQQFCVSDFPAGGDTSQLERKHNINDQGWTTYVSMYTLCYEPQEGSNRLQLQYKNGYGDESVVYTRQFTFSREN